MSSLRHLPTVAEARARYSHGTRARYNYAKCRCAKCRAANRKYERDRAAAHRQPWRVRHVHGGTWLVVAVATEQIVFKTKDRVIAYAVRDQFNADDGTLNPNALIDAGEVRSHLLALKLAGIGRRTVAAAALVSDGVIARLRDGDIKRTRRSCAARILAVGVDAAPDHSCLESASSWELIDRLCVVGCERTWLEQLLGLPRHALTTRRDGITLHRARSIRALYANFAAHLPHLVALSTAAASERAIETPAVLYV